MEHEDATVEEASHQPAPAEGTEDEQDDDARCEDLCQSASRMRRSPAITRPDCDRRGSLPSSLQETQMARAGMELEIMPDSRRQPAKQRASDERASPPSRGGASLATSRQDAPSRVQRLDSRARSAPARSGSGGRRCAAAPPARAARARRRPSAPRARRSRWCAGWRSRWIAPPRGRPSIAPGARG